MQTLSEKRPTIVIYDGSLFHMQIIDWLWLAGLHGFHYKYWISCDAVFSSNIEQLLNECYSFFIWCSFSFVLCYFHEYCNNSISTMYRFPILWNIPFDILTLESGHTVWLYSQTLYNFEWWEKKLVSVTNAPSLLNQNPFRVWDRIERIKCTIWSQIKPYDEPQGNLIVSY